MRWILVLAALGGVIARLDGQGNIAPPGSRIRIHLPTDDGSFERGIEGTLVRVAGDTLTLQPLAGGPLRMFPEVSKAQVFQYMGRRTHSLRGAVIGGATGLIMGGLLGAVAGCEAPAGPVCGQRREVGLEATLIMAAAGSATGFVIGTLASSGIWVPTLLAPPGGSGLGIGPHKLSLRFAVSF